MLADLARAIAAGAEAAGDQLAVICRDGPRMAMLARALAFFAPDIEVLEFPAWDCLPYDRVSPHAAVVAQRMTTLARLARVKGREHPAVLLTTVNAVLQRVPARELVAKQSLSAAPGNMLPMAGITQWLELNGFNRASTVREAGDYAVRGGIVDLFAPGMDEPVRLDFFGDTLESIRSFDPETQRTNAELRALDLVPMAEFQLTTDTIRAVPHRLCRGVRRRRARRRALRSGERRPPLRRHGALAAAVPHSAWKRCSIISTDSPHRASSRWPKKPPTSGSRRSPTIIRRARRRSIRPAAARPISRCRRTGFISPKPNGASGSTTRRWRG